MKRLLILAGLIALASSALAQDAVKIIKPESVAWKSSPLLKGVETTVLIGDPAKAGRVLGWEPEVSFKDLIELMVDADIAELKGTQAMAYPAYMLNGNAPKALKLPKVAAKIAAKKKPVTKKAKTPARTS